MSLLLISNKTSHSFLSFHHDNVIAKLGLDGWIRIDGSSYRWTWQCKCGILKRANHSTSNHPSQITARSRFIFAVCRCHFIELLTGLQFFHRLEHFWLFFAKNVSDFQRISTSAAASATSFLVFSSWGIFNFQSWDFVDMKQTKTLLKSGTEYWNVKSMNFHYSPLFSSLPPDLPLSLAPPFASFLGGISKFEWVNYFQKRKLNESQWILEFVLVFVVIGREISKTFPTEVFWTSSIVTQSFI